MPGTAPAKSKGLRAGDVQPRSESQRDTSSAPTTPAQPRAETGSRNVPSGQHNSEPRVQSGVVESAKKSLVRAASTTPPSHVSKPT